MGQQECNSADSGSMILPIVFPEGKLAKFKKDDSYEEPLKNLFHDLSDEIRNDVIAKQLRAGESSNGGLCVWCTSMGSPKHIDTLDDISNDRTSSSNNKNKQLNKNDDIESMKS